MNLYYFHRIETESQALPPSVRKIIYTHLAAFLPVGIQALTKRAKKLRLNEQDDKLKEPINRLREGMKNVTHRLHVFIFDVSRAVQAERLIWSLWCLYVCT